MVKARNVTGNSDVRGTETDFPSLDPEDWAEFQALAHDLLDKALVHLKDVREKPVWQEMSAEAIEAFNDTLPENPQGTEAVCRDLQRFVLPYGTGNIHPRFFGWVHGTGTAGGIIAEMMAAAMNTNCGGREHAAVYVERQVIDWWRQVFRFPLTSSGLLVSGTSMATLIALNVARNAALPHDVRQQGLHAGGNESGPRLIAYTSRQAHGSTDKAMEILGLGSQSLRKIDVDESGGIEIASLTSAIAADRDAGLRPFAIIASAGTVNVGAFDQLDELAALAEKERLWLHVDGAFGALAILSPKDKHKVRGIEKADSLAFDLHKWLHVAYDAGIVLMRDGERHLATFESEPDYLAGAERGIAAGQPWFCSFGPELSRGFRALKVWFTMKEHGLDRLGRKIGDNCRQAEWLGRRVGRSTFLELMAPVTLNIVCFRFVDQRLTEKEFDAVNREIVIRLQETGIAAPSTTRLNGRLAIRVNITNHRTVIEDLEILVKAVEDTGKAIVTLQEQFDHT